MGAKAFGLVLCFGALALYGLARLADSFEKASTRL